MHVVTAIFEATPGKEAALEEALLLQAANSLREEEGCLRFDVARDNQSPSRFVLYEIYEDRPAFDAHLQTPHYKLFRDKTAELVSNKTVDQWTLLSDTA